MQISIIGQGYVGLPLAIAASKVGFNVNGIDTDQIKISDLNKGISPIEDISNSEMKSAITSGNYKASSETYIDPSIEIICICVPTKRPMPAMLFSIVHLTVAMRYSKKFLGLIMPNYLMNWVIRMWPLMK